MFHAFVYALVVMVAASCHGSELNQQIIGGQPIPGLSIPFMVRMERRGREDCGASIIAVNWVLSAASCINIPLGDITLHLGTEVLDAGFTPTVESQILHPLYTGQKGSAYNVGLLKLEPPLTKDSGVTSIRLNYGKRPASGQGFVYGWGQTSEDGPKSVIVQSGGVDILHDRLCDVQDNLYDIGETSFCVGDKRGETVEFCPGDIGGPFVMILDDPKESVQYGILTETQCSKQYASIIEDVSQHGLWIHAHTGL